MEYLVCWKGNTVWSSCIRTGICVIALACPVRIIFPHGLRPTLQGEWWIQIHVESLLASPMPFSVHWAIIITNVLIIDRKLLRYYQFQPYMGHKPVIPHLQVWYHCYYTPWLCLGLVCNNNDIILVPGYNYNIPLQALLQTFHENLQIKFVNREA